MTWAAGAFCFAGQSVNHPAAIAPFGFCAWGTVLVPPTLALFVVVCR